MLPKLRVDRDVLPNDLRITTVELPHLHGASLVVYAKVGSRYEPPTDNGLSHFLEHMLFRGTRKFPSSYALNLAIEELGGTLHAETGRDYSLYQINLAPDAVVEGISSLGEQLGAPRLSDIELEREIILEEIGEDLDERGRDVNLDDKVRAAMFPGHGLGQKITGPRRNVRGFSGGDVRRHLRRHYGARNLVQCLWFAGDDLERVAIEADAVASLLTRLGDVGNRRIVESTRQAIASLRGDPASTLAFDGPL